MKLALLALMFVSTLTQAETAITVNRDLTVSLPPVEVSATNLKPMTQGMLTSIHDHIKYPYRALYKRIQGTAVMVFTVSKTKGVRDVELAESSGHDILDKAAAEAITKLDTSVIPDSVADEEFLMKVPVRFRITSPS